MAAAARAGDSTEHGDTLGPALGSTKVKIENKGAWRALVDTHKCSQSDGNKPHVGGVVTMGSTKVRIEGTAAVRMGDQITEAGKPNKITQGSTKVSIG
jgi:uncharacterized Zn-binding protein involved in type VI secretion